MASVSQARLSPVAAALQIAHSSQSEWVLRDLRSRLRIVRSLRDLLADKAQDLLACFPDHLRRGPGESLTSEVIPLADACRFLELRARSLLAPATVARSGRPLWLSKVNLQVRHEPHGVVLVIGPANYPLFLPGVQVIQALVAGNSVLVKPGRGGSSLMLKLRDMAIRAGFPEGLFTVLDESVQTAREAISLGVDKIVVTGSLMSGRAVLRDAAEHVTPVTAELSGNDPVFVLASADLEKAAAAVAFGMRLNHGETCIAPRRLFVQPAVSNRFGELLRAALGYSVSVTDFISLDQARSEFALGATVFGDDREARSLAGKIQAGVVVINDMVVPTADPRISFGGCKLSGFGKTRGPEGLLEMTVTKLIVVQRGKRLRHLEPMPAQAEELFLSFLSAQHRRSLKNRLKGWLGLCRVAQQIRTGK